jgi:hypothetical protein
MKPPPHGLEKILKDPNLGKSQSKKERCKNYISPISGCP